MALTETERQQIHRGLMRYWSSLRELLAVFDKADLRAAIDATDEWIEDNQVSFNNALPNPFKTSATQDQKTLLFCAVALARVSIPFLRQIFGEVD